MIILNPTLATYNQYDEAQKHNEAKLKQVMNQVIVSELEASEPAKVGKGAPIERRTLPVAYTNEKKTKKVKTFKL